MHIHTCIYIYIYTHTCIYMYTCIYIYTDNDHDNDDDNDNDNDNYHDMCSNIVIMIILGTHSPRAMRKSRVLEKSCLLCSYTMSLHGSR